ncbi:DUF6477 family protein [Gemmobacter serpentinus]|uniref:DUF6477 family protein n=1 Tax=Gemmobacter serpentinus TaxID=2652247 RepID=UPI00124E8898|nr:DUF6477 family protein [Gemmobacter serpentinus]
MTDFRTSLATLRRPALLLRAARFGLADYRRDRDLKRLLRQDANGGPERILPRLIATEEELEQTRRAGDARYSLSQHIEVLIALIAEMTLVNPSQQSRV